MSSIEKLNQSLLQINQTSSGRRLFLQSLPFLLVGCASSERTRYREGNNQGQSSSLSVADEQRMTREYLPQMKKEYPSVTNSFAQGYLSSLGQKVVQRNNLVGKPYHYNFTLVNSKMINAFALPAGEVFVTTGLIGAADTEAELAGVIGHEVGHIQARHTAERMTQAEKGKTKQILFGLGGAILGGAAGYALGKKLCSKEDRDCLRRISTYGAAAGGAGGLLIQKFAFMANSREDEMEADRIGFKTSLNAGYDKDTIGLFYEKLLRMEQKHKRGNKIQAAFTDALSTHPPSIERVNQIREMAMNASNVDGIKSTQSFSRLKRMV
jgi:predicted Zn-dependent protease